MRKMVGKWSLFLKLSNFHMGRKFASALASLIPASVERLNFDKGIMWSTLQSERLSQLIPFTNCFSKCVAKSSNEYPIVRINLVLESTERFACFSARLMKLYSFL